MDLETSVVDSQTLRRYLMAPNPMQRAIALHALEVEVERLPAGDRSLGNEVEKFVSRGIPFYALNDPHYCSWVGKAASYWDKLHA
jgi:hypothetical protein